MTSRAMESDNVEQRWDIGPNAYVEFGWLDPSVPPILVLSTGRTSVALVAPSDPEQLVEYARFISDLAKAANSMSLLTHPAMGWGRLVQSAVGD
jgi:hypothetical protein